MGKTLQVLAFITLIPHIRKLNGENKSLPPFLSKCIFSLTIAGNRTPTRDQNLSARAYQKQPMGRL